MIGGIHVPVDDGVDKLNRKYTLLVFLFLALPIFTKQYIGDPIECFTPTYFTEPQARYVNSYCWTASTYYLVAADADDEDYDIVGQVGKNQVRNESFSYNPTHFFLLFPSLYILLFSSVFLPSLIIIFRFSSIFDTSIGTS